MIAFATSDVLEEGYAERRLKEKEDLKKEEKAKNKKDWKYNRWFFILDVFKYFD